MSLVSKKRLYKNMALYLGPTLLLIIVFYLLPVITDLIIAFTDVKGDLKFTKFTFENFEKIFRDKRVISSLVLTGTFVFFTLTLFNVGLGLILALISHAVPQEIAGFFRSIWLLPRMAPKVIYGLLWLWTLDPTENGLLNQIVIFFGGSPTDLVNNYPVLVIILANGFIGCSMGLLIFSSAIKSIPEHLYMAARVDGASGFAITRKITLPAIRWQILFVSMYQAVSLLVTFEVIFLITRGGPFYDTTVYSLYAYRRGFEKGAYAYGAALAILLVLIGIIGSVILWKMSKGDEMMAEPKIEGY